MRLIVAFIIVMTLSPSLQAAESLYATHCAACHGEKGEGGFGPPVAGMLQTRDEFNRIVRDGKGMMPALPNIDDRSLDGLYDELRERGQDETTASLSFSTISRAVLARDHVRSMAWGSVVVMSIGFFVLLFARFARWASFGRAKRFYAALGFWTCCAILVRTLLVDVLSVSSLYAKAKRRWFIHGLMLYGFAGLIVADVLISLVNPERAALPFFSPLKIVANVSGLALLTGLVIITFRFFSDPYEDNGVTFAGDIFFLVFMAIVVVSGFGVETTRYLTLPALTPYVYFVHIFAVVLLFVTAPMTRFAHILSTVFFVLDVKLSEALVKSKRVRAFIEEPAPGRHHKSQGIAQSLFENDVHIRYFP